MQGEPGTYQWMVRGVIRVLGGICVVLGAGMILGGPIRFSGPGFATARLVPGGVYAWGASLLVCGVVIVVAILSRWRRDWGIIGLRLAAFWFLFFAVGLAITTVETPAGAVTGPIAYGGMSLLCFLCAAGGQELAEQ